jgi:hypothetical protein
VKRRLIEREHDGLSIRRQCLLLGLGSWRDSANIAIFAGK